MDLMYKMRKWEIREKDPSSHSKFIGKLILEDWDSNYDILDDLSREFKIGIRTSDGKEIIWRGGKDQAVELFKWLEIWLKKRGKD